MAAPVPAPVTMELAQFVAKIVADAFDGVREALRLQEERLAEISAAAALDPAEFAHLTITDPEVDVELAQLFPRSDPSHPHVVYAGAPYQPALPAGQREVPPFADAVRVHLEEADYTRPRRSAPFQLTALGVEKIRAAVRTQLGAAALAVLRQTIARGIPHLAVDSGRVSAKMSLTLQDTAAGSASATASVPAKNVRLLVKTIDDRDPQNLGLRVDILSELQITFKTIT
jgi:hypothetical protein